MSLPALDHEQVLTGIGARSGLPIIVAVHSTRLGPALGGCRMWGYDSWLDAQLDALRLSTGMTLKNAVAGLAKGGGKSVIGLAPGEQLDAARRRDALLDLGDAVESLGGAYETAEDVGTTEHDMLVVRERTEHVVGLPPEHGGAGEPAGPTSLGVYVSVLATLREVFGTDDVAGRRITISGLGQVGGRLARRLAAEGAVLTVSDVVSARRELADELGATWVDAADAFALPADLVVPAGVGGALSPTVIAALDARAVVGPANNQLAEPDGAERLAERGILYAPDFVVNAGGVIHLSMTADGATTEQIDERVREIGTTLSQVFASARTSGITPLAAAELLAAERLG
jgi:leucine dehydrogenase